MAKSTEHRPASDADALVEEYLRRVDSGEQVDKDAFLAQHPDVAPALQSFFANEQLMRKWAADSKLPAGDTTPKDANPTMAPAIDPAKLSGPTGSVVLPAMMGRYRIEKELGRGAMGSVYRAHDMELDRPVALKIPHFASNDNPELISRFLREARSAAVLAHPNICRVYDVSEFQGTRYIAMEFIDGKPLTSFISAGSVQPKQAASVIRKLALGLAEAHKQGIIHRDLKPDNILINSKGEPVLTDFGLARATAQGSSSATQDGVILGSPAYMPPEQAAGNLSDMGPTSDVYSLGVVLYQMLTGDVPFRGSVVEVLASVLMKVPKKVREAKPEIDPALAAICDKMMSKKSADRYPSMADVATAVNDWLKTAATQQSAATIAPAKPQALSGEMNLADAAAKPKLGTTHSIAPKQTQTGAAKPQASIPPGTKTIAGHSAKQLKDVAELVVQLLARNDYPEAIRIIEGLPEYERTPELRTLLGEAYELKSTVEKLERQLEKHLNVVDIPALKKCVDQLLKIKPGHPRAKEIRKALNTEGKRGVLKLRKKDGQFDAVGNVWEPWHLAAGVGIILVFGVIAYFGVTIYVKNSMQTVAIEIDDPTATVKIDGNTATINAQGTGELKLTLGNHTYSVTQGATTVITDGSYEVKRGEKNVLRITLKAPKPGDSVAGTTPVNNTPSQKVKQTLAIRATVDDTDEVQIFADRAVWKHGPGNPPLGIAINNVPWTDFSQPLANSAATSFHKLPTLPTDAQIRKVKGPGNVTLDTKVPGMWSIKFYDGDPGAGEYEIEISCEVEVAVSAPPGNTPPLAVAPFNAAQAKAHQEAWAKHLGVPVEYTNSIGMKFRMIPPGEYLIGMTQAEVDAHLAARGNDFGMAERFRNSAPQHKVVLTKAYYLGNFEVTQKEFETVMGRNPSYMSPNGPGKDNVAGQDRSNAPVEYLTWADSAAFCAKLSEREKLLAGKGYRLPTEAEWEAACRAGTSTVFSFGDALAELPNYGWSSADVPKNPAKMTHLVGQLQPNPFGMFDMHGNAWEWCQDFFDPNAYQAFANQPAQDPTGPASGTLRVFRGGGLSFDAEFLRSGLRHGNSGDAVDHNIGFRVLLPAEAVPKTVAVPIVATPPESGDTPQLPDLIATDLYYDDDKQNLVLEVQNQGPTAAAQGLVAEVEVSGLKKGNTEYERIMVSIPVPTDVFAIETIKIPLSRFNVTSAEEFFAPIFYVTLDPKQKLKESNRANNSYGRQVDHEDNYPRGDYKTKAGMPDLVITDIEISGNAVLTQFANQGSGVSGGDFIIRFNIRNQEFKTNMAYRWRVPALNVPTFTRNPSSGAGYVLPLGNLNLKAGDTIEVEATIDPEGRVRESNRQNNVFKKTLTVK